MGSEIKASQFLAPRYWPTWLLLGLMRLSTRLPLSLLYAIGAAIGEIIYWIMPRRRRIARINVDLCFPNRSDMERAALVRACFRSAGMSILETSLAWWGNDGRLSKLAHIEGLEHIEQAKKDQRPILLLSGHFCCTDIGGKLLSFHQRFQVMYKPAKNRLFNAIAVGQRRRVYQEAVPRKQSRRLLKNLKQGMTTWYGPDQSFGREDTVFAPFFGIPAATLTATSRLARFANAVVIPYFPFRLPGKKGYRLIIKPPLENFPSDSLEQDATAVNRVIEDAVRIAPEQYLWLHRRFHHRPEGESEFY